jgi:hypothetical protein
LRKVIEHNPAEPVFIKKVWGVGYVFNNAAHSFAKKNEDKRDD